MKNIVANMESLARKWHRGSVRKGLIGVPYVQHPEAVVALLRQWGYDEKRDAETLAVAWGHDLLEDTKVSRGEIIAAAGKAVYDGIETLTFRYEKGISDEQYDSEKAAYVARVSEAAPNVRVVKVADCLCNTYDLARMDLSRATKYLKKAKALFSKASIKAMKHSKAIKATFDDMMLLVDGVKVLSYDEMLTMLAKKGADHTDGYYHYTTWDCLAKMLEKNVDGHRFLLLSNVTKTNDKIEVAWDNRVYMSCFSYSKYEDVAMWLNYGKRRRDAVRVHFDRQAVRNWIDQYRNGSFKGGLYYAKMNGDKITGYEKIPESDIEYVGLYDLAYVVHSKFTTDEHPGNVEYRRKFYLVKRNGTRDWSDAIYEVRQEEMRQGGILPIFKKRGWAYEREVRLIVQLTDGAKKGDKIAIAFDEPFETLIKHMQGMPMGTDIYHQPVLRGPWYAPAKGMKDMVIEGLRLERATKSDYKAEIAMLDSKR